MHTYLYDANHVRYELYQTHEGKPYNWLFFPGGPGADSSYLRSLYDCICPFSLFRRDERFQRPNIELFYIENAGHFTWIENPEATKEAFKRLICELEEVGN